MKSELYVSVKFNDVMLGDAIRMIHSPERWGIGAGLMAGLSTFVPRDIEGPLIYGDECMVHFNAFGSNIRLIGKLQLKSKVTIASPDCDIPHTTIDTIITPDHESTRALQLSMHVRSDYPIPHTAQDLRDALQLGLFSCVEPIAEEHEILRLYRQLLKTK